MEPRAESGAPRRDDDDVGDDARSRSRAGEGGRRRRRRGPAAARELRAEGHTPVVFERGDDVGGVWVYDPRVEVDDVTGTDPNRARVHGSMYASLRTNLPRECMGYESFPFTRTFAGDDRRFCGHGEVRAYLAAYADHHDIAKDVRLRREVIRGAPSTTSRPIEIPTPKPRRSRRRLRDEPGARGGG